jgi:hypothetical protein
MSQVVLSETDARLLCEIQFKEKIAQMDEVIVYTSSPVPPEFAPGMAELKQRAIKSKAAMVRRLEKIVSGAPLPPAWRDGIVRSW